MTSHDGGNVMRKTLLFLLSLSACAPAGPTFTEADKAAIMEQRAAMAAAWNAGDAEKAAAVYAEDAVVMLANQPAINGKLAILEAIRAFPPVSEVKFHGEEFLAESNVAVIRGSVSMMMMLPGASAAVADTSKYIEVWRRQAEGTWKLHWDIANTDRPAEAFVPPAPAR